MKFRSSLYIVGYILALTVVATLAGGYFQWLLVTEGAPLWLGGLVALVTGFGIGRASAGPAYEGWRATERWRNGG